MARKSISWILKFTSNLPDDEEKVKCLKANDNSAIRTILKYTFDPNIVWNLPEGEPPYTPCAFPHQESRLYQEARRLYIFIEGGNDNLNPMRRETMFLEFLEGIDAEDAKLVLGAKAKKLPEEYDGLTYDVVKKAFPEIF